MRTNPPQAGTAPRPAVTGDEECRFVSLDSAAFDAATFERSWLIERVLVLNQPGVIGGPKKTLKSSLVVDMAVSISTGRPFLGHFAVPGARPVAVFSGESGPETLRETARRVCAAREVALKSCAVHWVFRLPQLYLPGHRLALGRFLRARQVQVAFIDPLYLCLLGGDRPVSASNLYEVGPLLWRAAQACLDAGATPVFVHHATKSAAKRSTDPDEPPDLDDLAFAGIGEFARQWVLVRRLGRFQPSVGRHHLVLAAGGSAGHAGQWELTVDEGVLGQDFTGRRWEVRVAPAAAAPDGGDRPGRRAAGGRAGYATRV